ncbi:MAG: cyclodeaminase/cyclohydrolase family protein [Thermodesulfobacteriota bacterium]
MTLVEMSVGRFARELSGGAATPGGGSAAALAGALGACLCAMTARLTVGREKFREAWAEMEVVMAEADELAARLIELVDEDARAYEKVMAAYKIPKEDEARRAEAIQTAMKEAAGVPFQTLEAVARAAELAEKALARGNPNCLSDVGVAGQLLRAAAMGAAYNVRINLPALKDQELVGRLERETRSFLDRVLAAADRLENEMARKLA